METLSELTASPLLALKVISCVAALVFIVALLRRRAENWLLSLLILLHPRFLDLVSSQQRSALALALFISALDAQTWVRRWALYALATSIHTVGAALVVSSVIYSMGDRIPALLFRSSRETSPDRPCDHDSRLGNGGRWISEEGLQTLIVLGGILLIASLLSFGLESLGSLVDDRRTLAGYRSGGGMYMGMWLGTFVAFVLLRPDLMLDVSGYFFCTFMLAATLGWFSGAYTARYIAISIPFLALSTAQFSRRDWALFFPIITLNTGLSYWYWL